jgi:hypothetical protein
LSENIPAHTAELDLQARGNQTVSLDGRIIIDARDKPIPNSARMWTDRGELQKYNQVIDAIRTVCESAANYNDVDVGAYRLLTRAAATKSLRELGFTTAQDVRILGTVPDWWTSPQKVSRKWVLDRNKWEEHKRELLGYFKSIKTS